MPEPTDLVYLGLPREGLEEARRDVERHAEKITERLYIPDDLVDDEFREEAIADVLGAISCPDEWPIR